MKTTEIIHPSFTFCHIIESDRLGTPDTEVECQCWYDVTDNSMQLLEIRLDSEGSDLSVILELTHLYEPIRERAIELIQEINEAA